MVKPPSFVCPRCGAESFNLTDIAMRYCGACKMFVDDAGLSLDFPAADPYHDDRYVERRCDCCGRPYRGRAVYCSLECALKDA
jgi:hypothetical protein